MNKVNIDIRLSGYDREMCPNTEVSMFICRAIETAIRWRGSVSDDVRIRLDTDIQVDTLILYM